MNFPKHTCCVVPDCGECGNTVVVQIENYYIQSLAHRVYVLWGSLVRKWKIGHVCCCRCCRCCCFYTREIRHFLCRFQLFIHSSPDFLPHFGLLLLWRLQFKILFNLIAAPLSAAIHPTNGCIQFKCLAVVVSFFFLYEWIAFYDFLHCVCVCTVHASSNQKFYNFQDFLLVFFFFIFNQRNIAIWHHLYTCRNRLKIKTLHNEILQVDSKGKRERQKYEGELKENGINKKRRALGQGVRARFVFFIVWNRLAYLCTEHRLQ